MSGVILENGVQYERCNICGEFVLIDSLHYEPRSENHPYGRDVCPTCWLLTPEQRDEHAEQVATRSRAKMLAKARANGWDAEWVRRPAGYYVLNVTGPVAVGDRVVVEGRGEGRVSSIRESGTDVWVRLDNNPVPSGQRGSAEAFHRDLVARASS